MPSARAAANPVIAFVTPGPEVTSTQGREPGRMRACPIAMKSALDSWRTCTTRIAPRETRAS